MLVNEVKELIQKAEKIFSDTFPNQRHNITWDLQWCSHSMYGRAWFSQDKIQLSQFHWVLSPRKAVWNTICHELCHLYNTYNDGHGPHWKAIAAKMSVICDCHIQRVGGDKENCNISNPKKPTPVATLTCPHCGHVFTLYRRGRAYQVQGVGFWCSVCGKREGQLIFKKVR